MTIVQGLTVVIVVIGEVVVTNFVAVIEEVVVTGFESVINLIIITEVIAIAAATEVRNYSGQSFKSVAERLSEVARLIANFG